MALAWAIQPVTAVARRRLRVIIPAIGLLLLAAVLARPGIHLLSTALAMPTNSKTCRQAIWMTRAG